MRKIRNQKEGNVYPWGVLSDYHGSVTELIRENAPKTGKQLITTVWHCQQCPRGPCEISGNCPEPLACVKKYKMDQSIWCAFILIDVDTDTGESICSDRCKWHQYNSPNLSPGELCYQAIKFTCVHHLKKVI